MQGINSIAGHFEDGTIGSDARRDPGHISSCPVASEIRELSHQDKSWGSRQEVDLATVTRHWLPSHKPVQPVA